MENIKAVYAEYGWARVFALIGLLLCGLLLYGLSGGMPPWAWRFLWQILPQISTLMASQSLSLLGLLLLSISLLILWAVLLILVWRVSMHCWQFFYERQHFQFDLEEAERMADANVEAQQRAELQNQMQASLAANRPVPQAPQQTAQRHATENLNFAATGGYAASQASHAVGGMRIYAGPSTSDLGSVNWQPPERPTRVLPAPSSQQTIEEINQSKLMRKQLRLVSNPAREKQPYEPVAAIANQTEDLEDMPTLPGLNEKHDTHPHARLERIRPDATALRLVVGIGLDPGIVRRNSPNEDNLFAIQGVRMTDRGPMPAGLFVVADGMGGHANGREASRSAIHSISDVIVPALLRDVSGRGSEEEEHIFADMLKDGVHRANLAIYRRNRDLPQMMGTTVTSALIVDNTAYVVNVGDSRTYLYRASEGLQQVTRDHSVVARLVESGAILPDDIYTHPQRNQIYRCLGEHASVEIDSFIVHLKPDDILILCSDGLWEMVRDGAIEKIVASAAHNPSQISSILVHAALSRGGVDNISVVVVGIVETED
ncbi:PP2C family protein-serine/threonine phosphatase [Tengunoibacter tsumagoiensis]|uniref:PPM-type phosphatase domain-containing protein n=1 Tax=Tengunoibacter tsumagoiensis TaxID=2014871 RepID=A0A402A646_9CHLR|nr:protein phosphatase 2C domain-containing protein [Tengunoibacter tsumagoiensis]GCE14602.1 hypothetical protein KTT_44610 [Tengunoibacter tsumagoiensis]